MEVSTDKSYIIEKFPIKLYQTNISPKGKQDSSTPFIFNIQLSSKDFEKIKLDSIELGIHFAILLYDTYKRPLVRNKKNDKLVPLVFPNTNFSYNLNKEKKIIQVKMSRKNLPISEKFGSSKFIISCLIKKTENIIFSSPFLVLSKQSIKKYKTVPKRKKISPRVTRILDENDYNDIYFDKCIKKHRKVIFSSKEEKKEKKQEDSNYYTDSELEPFIKDDEFNNSFIISTNLLLKS